PKGVSRPTSLDQVPVLVVHADAQRKSVAEHGQMPPGSAPDVDDAHAVSDHLAQQVDLGLEVRADGRGLRCWVKRLSQKTASVDLFVGHRSSLRERWAAERWS